MKKMKGRGENWCGRKTLSRGRDAVGAWGVKLRRKKGKRKGWFLKRMEREKEAHGTEGGGR